MTRKTQLKPIAEQNNEFVKKVKKNQQYTIDYCFFLLFTAYNLEKNKHSFFLLIIGNFSKKKLS